MLQEGSLNTTLLFPFTFWCSARSDRGGWRVLSLVLRARPFCRRGTHRLRRTCVGLLFLRPIRCKRQDSPPADPDAPRPARLQDSTLFGDSKKNKARASMRSDGSAGLFKASQIGDFYSGVSAEPTSLSLGTPLSPRRPTFRTAGSWRPLDRLLVKEVAVVHQCCPYHQPMATETHPLWRAGGHSRERHPHPQNNETGHKERSPRLDVSLCPIQRT